MAATPARRFPLAIISISALAIAAAYGSTLREGGAPAWAPWAFVLGMACLLVAVMVLGASRPGRGVGRLAIPFGLVWFILAGGFAAVLILPAHPDTPLWLGLPRGAAIVLYGIGLLPVLILPLAYALTFDSITLSEADLERVRAEARRARAATAPDTTGPPA